MLADSGLDTALLADEGLASGSINTEAQLTIDEKADSINSIFKRKQESAGDDDFDRVQAVPDWLADRFPGGAIGFAEAMMITVTFCSVAIIILNIYSSVAGLGVASDGTPVRPSYYL